MFDSDDEYDPDEHEDQEEEDEDEDEDEDMSKSEVRGGKAQKTSKDKDEDDDSEDDDISLDEEMEETNVICSLTAGKTEQANINLIFVEGEVILLETSGDNEIHLLGNYIHQGDGDSDSDSEFDGSDDYSDLYDSDDDIELDSEEEEAVAKITEIPDKSKAKKALPMPKKEEKIASIDKKRKVEELGSPAKSETEDLSKTQKKKLAKKAKLEAETAVAPIKKEEKKPVAKEEKMKKRTLPSGLIIEDIKVGDGPIAKTGKRLGMRYIGKLTNGKQFDANTSGKPFTFVVGKGEVIRGWDEGLTGMAVGGERRLIIPPQLAYGNQKIPGIPKNSTLRFDVKLVSIN
ncbi:hypothetical protein L204_100147 [Cryptococcus depauperatus]|nr:FK506-binding protein 4 [Cryptococcus depauperatus CBS 7855]